MVVAGIDISIEVANSCLVAFVLSEHFLAGKRTWQASVRAFQWPLILGLVINVVWVCRHVALPHIPHVDELPDVLI